MAVHHTSHHHAPAQGYEASASDDTLLDEEHQPFLSEDLEDAIKLDDRARPARKNGMTPIPKAQLATLCAVRLVDPVMFTQIFPYVNEMMEFLRVTDDPSKTGLYSGIVVSF